MAEDLASLGKRMPVVLSGKENYIHWKTSMEDVLTYLGLWEYIKDGYTLPTDADERIKAERAQRKALALIRLQVTGPVHTFVVSATTPVEAWNALKREFEVSSETPCIFLRRELHDTRMAEEDTLDNHIQKMRDIYDKLRLVGDTLSESDFTMALLVSLPSSWDSFMSTIELKDLESSDAKVRANANNAVHMRIKDEYLRRQSRNGESSSYAFDSRPRHDKANTECRYCHKRGHWYRECYKRIADEEKNQSANIVTQLHFSFTATSDSPILTSSQWVGVTGAADHVVTDREAFSNYTETPGQFVTGTGGARVPIQGRGSVATLMYSGNSSHVVVLKDCLHIPSSQPNLLSLLRLDKAGGSIRIQSGIIKLRAPGCTLICDGTLEGGLYKLNMHSIASKKPSVRQHKSHKPPTRSC